MTEENKEMTESNELDIQSETPVDDENTNESNSDVNESIDDTSDVTSNTDDDGDDGDPNIQPLDTPHPGQAGGNGACVRAVVSGLTPGQSIAVTVGAGGNSGGYANSTSFPDYCCGASGGNSSFGSYVVVRGGGGGSESSAGTTYTGAYSTSGSVSVTNLSILSPLGKGGSAQTTAQSYTSGGAGIVIVEWNISV